MQKRTLINEIKNSKGEVNLFGWVHELRDLANIKFVLLRDSSGVIQCALKKDSKVWNKFSELTLESVIEVKGMVKEANVKSEEVTINDYEIEIHDLNLLHKAENLPIQVVKKDKSIQTDLSKRLDYRYLDIRKKEVKAIFKIQSTIINSFREFFYKKGFIEIQPPGIIATSTEGGTNLFKAKYFDKDVYLAQSPQLYKQMAAISLERVFSTSPVWRAEKHNTIRHLNEARQMDIEVAFADEFDVMKYLEDAVVFIVKNVIEENKEELKTLNLILKVPKSKYLSYQEAIEVLNKNGFKMKYGEDFEPTAEKKFDEIYKDTILFIHDWPQELKPFYIWPKGGKEKVSAGFDALYGGIEISSGGKRIHIPEILIRSLKDKKLNPKDFSWYVDAFRTGSPEHAGWSIGLERFTMTLLKLDNIREACLFPRDRDRLTP